MAGFPPDVYGPGFVIFGAMLLLFIDAAYAMPLQPRGAKLAVLAVFAAGLLALAVLPDLNEVHAHLAFTGLSMLFALAIAGFALRGGHLNQVNALRGWAFVLATAYLLWASRVFLGQDFGGTWSDAQFRFSGGRGAIFELGLLLAAKGFDFLGAKVCALVTVAGAGLGLWRAYRLLHLPDLGEAQRVLATQFAAVSAQAPALPVSEVSNPDGGAAKYWWHRHLAGDWREPECRALLRAYARLGGPYFPGGGIPLKGGFLQLDADAINRHLAGGSLLFHEASGRFRLTGRGYALIYARDEDIKWRPRAGRGIPAPGWRRRGR